MLFSSFTIRAQQTVNITLPANVSFNVVDVNEDTEANSVTLQYRDAELDLDEDYIAISIKANTANFSRPTNAGGFITASSVSWTTSNAQGGSGVNGTLSYVTYNRVFNTISDPDFGSLLINFKLAAPGSGIRAGAHTLICTWKIEILTP